MNKLPIELIYKIRNYISSNNDHISFSLINKKNYNTMHLKYIKPKKIFLICGILPHYIEFVTLEKKYAIYYILSNKFISIFKKLDNECNMFELYCTTCNKIMSCLKNNIYIKYEIIYINCNSYYPCNYIFIKEKICTHCYSMKKSKYFLLNDSIRDFIFTHFRIMYDDISHGYYCYITEQSIY